MWILFDVDESGSKQITLVLTQILSVIWLLRIKRISQPLGSILKVLLVIMLLFGLVLSEDSCNPGQTVKAKQLNYILGNYLGVQNKSVVTTVGEMRTLYTITDTNSPAIFIFDPQAKRFICMMKRRKNGIKFVAKIIPKPKTCMFKELPAEHGYVKYALASYPNITLKVNNRPIRHHSRHKVEDRFAVVPDLKKCRSSNNDFCNYINSHHVKNKYKNMPKKIRDVCRK